MSAPALEVRCPVPVPDGLLAAFDAYETALLANDVRALDRLFAPGPDTVRGDGRVLLVGHDAIAGFRSGRRVIPTRRVAQLHVRPAGLDAALVMASTVEPATGATGLQTQLWQRIAGEWKVTAAHVTLPGGGKPAAAPPVDPAVWRVVGTPLVPATGNGPLDGTTVAVKDLFDVAGQPVGAGNPAWLVEQEPRSTTAPAVAALLAAGAEITGIARTDEFAYSLAGQNAHYGTAPNPAVPGGIGGGSSGGPASAVALRQVAVGLGTDTAGSIRVPASYQGLVGVRPTYGAVSTAGMLPLAPSFDTVGWLTREVATARRVADVLLAGTATAAHRTLVLPAVEVHAADDVRAACADSRATLAAAGILPATETGDLEPRTLETWFAAFRTVQAFEAWQAHGDWISAHPGALGSDVGGRFAAAATVSADEADEARGVVAEARTRLCALLDGAVLVLPTSRGGAPARNAGAEVVEAERAGTLRLTCLAGLGGLPAVSLPLLRTSDGRPAGLCLVGATGTDLALLDLAATIEGTVR
ncbi:AtzH-like domain-containing protein [Amycolatopsis sp.]|uniref:AtzH-like domain-containing protein n=1 Tax=Amycolatopsis sp. TaxID=37632 RepID=UPI002CE5F7BE|nr:AtzH-like domain-containing protein [Amycolatopsis sp.]HVV08301.1 AtzH-like domain-containing protein [Amycolatopsis sp.]